MAIKKFNRTETSFTATDPSNDILGNDLINTIVGGTGNDIIDGGKGADIITGGGSTAGNETVNGDIYKVGVGDTIYGGKGNDTFRLSDSITKTTIIHGGTSDLGYDGTTAATLFATFNPVTDATTFKDSTGAAATAPANLNAAKAVATDIQLALAFRPGSTTSISTQATTVSGYNAVDTIEFAKSGDYTGLVFDGIERLELADGVSVRLDAEALSNNGGSQDLGLVNGGFKVLGTAGGKKETVTIELESEAFTFTPAATVVGATAKTYQFSDFQLDDFSSAYIFSNVDVIYDAIDTAKPTAAVKSYVRVDGSNDSETVKGSAGVDNATMRLGDDTYFGYNGNDLIIGHGGADYLDGGAGNDIFVIGGFNTGNQGTTSKADDGAKEWIATATIPGGKHDVILGGVGVDTLRITTGIGADTAAEGTVVLNNANFKSMEVVQVGGTAGRLNVEDSALQLINDHYYFRANSTVADTATTAGNDGGTINNVVVDASGLTTNGLRFEGNGNTQTFIGTTKNDTFVGNGGNDVLTGNAGADTFVFGKVYEQIVTGTATTVQTYVNTAFNLTGVDTITDFTSKTDKIQLNKDMFAAFGTAKSVVAGNLVVGAGATAADANDFLLFNTTTKMLSYDADGNGAGAAVDIVVLTGVNTLLATDFTLAA